MYFRKTMKKLEPLKKAKEKQKVELKKIFEHVLEHQLWYILALTIIILSITLLVISQDEAVTLIGSETYYHLSEAKNLGWRNFQYAPLSITLLLPEVILQALPFILAITLILALYSVSLYLPITKKFRLLFFLFLITSPIFIF